MLQVITSVNVPALNRVCGHVRLAIMVVQAFTTGAYYLLINNCLMIACIIC